MQTKLSHSKILLTIYETISYIFQNLNGETCTFADIFIVIDGAFTTTFTFWMNVLKFTGVILSQTYTTIFASKKINIVPNFTMNSRRFIVYGRISLLLLKNMIDSDSSPMHLQTASSLSFPTTKEVVSQPPRSCVLPLTLPSCEGCWEMFWSEVEVDPGRLAWGETSQSRVSIDLALDVFITI